MIVQTSKMDIFLKLQSSLKGKRVALTGPSQSILSGALGCEIEAHDIVARLNHQWPIEETSQKHLGSRMDILFHCCNRDFPIERLFNPDFQSLSFVCYENGFQAESLVARCRELDIPSLDITFRYRELREQLGTFPNTGLVAITLLLQTDLSRLSLYGLTFFREPYYAGYLGCGAEAANWQGDTPPERIWQHDLQRQFEYFCKLHRGDSRIWIDPYARRVFPQEIQNDQRYC